MTGRVNPDVKYRNCNYGNYRVPKSATGAKCKKRILASPVFGRAYVAWALRTPLVHQAYVIRIRAGAAPRPRTVG